MASIRVLILVCVCMAAVMSQHAVDGANNCGPVLSAINTCRNYLRQGGTVPDNCCKGVKSLNSAAKTTALKRSYCECLKSEARSAGIKEQFASSLPRKCGVNIGFPISFNMNCNSIH